MSLPKQVAEDYRTTSLSLKAHPCGFFRDGPGAGWAPSPAAALKAMRDRRRRRRSAAWSWCASGRAPPRAWCS